MAKDMSSIPILERDNYAEWTRKINAFFRFNNLYNIVHGREARPTNAADQPDWDKREMQATGAIEISLDNTNATHIHGIEGQAVQMWQKLESVHNTRTPGSRFNGMDTFFSIKKEDDEDLRSLITRVKAAMQHIKSLRPVGIISTPTVSVSSTSGSTTTAVYTLETLDEELIIMALLRALPEEYNSLRATLFIQSNLSLQIVETAFLAEDNQRQHATRDNTTALRTSVSVDWKHLSHRPQHTSSSPVEAAQSPKLAKPGKSDIICFFCKNHGHSE